MSSKIIEVGDNLDEVLMGLAACEKDMDQAEKDAEIYRIRKTQKIFDTRRGLLLKIPKFWYIVLAQNDDFSDYIRVEDLKYLEFMTDIFVTYDVLSVTDEDVNPRNFSITISFDSPDGEIAQQTIVKPFKTEIDEETGDEKLVSEAVDVEWPIELAAITPDLIKDKTSKDGKKNYRLGMKSFFAWFKWTGLKPGKEFRNGDELARLIVDEIFPYSVKLYTEAMPGINEEDESESEELDISSDEEEESKKHGLDDDEEEVPNKR